MMHPELATLKVKIIIYGVSRFLQSDINRSSIPAKRAFFVFLLLSDVLAAGSQQKKVVR